MIFVVTPNLVSRFTSYLFLFILLTAFNSCSEDQKSCEFPSLDKINNEKVYYYDNGLIARYYSFPSVKELSYRETGQLATINLISNPIDLFNNVNFSYDENDRLSHVVRYHEDFVFDSLQLTYDNQDRIIQLARYAYNPSADPVYHLLETTEYRYTGMNSTWARLYTPAEDERIWDIEFDTHSQALPLEIRLIDFASTPIYFGKNNPTKITYTFKDPRYLPGNRVLIQNFNYRYDSRGYPVELNLDGVITSYSYSCDKRSINDL